MPPDRLTIYHDGGCPLCAAEIAHYRRLDRDGRLAFVDVSETGAPTGPHLDRAAALARFHVRDEAGRLHSGAAGFAEVWARLPRWRLAARLARLPGVAPLLEAGYRAFLPLRPRIARLIAKS